MNHPQRQSFAERQLDQLLLEEGIISRVPPELTEAELEEFRAWEPVEIEGGSVSQTIIEDRR